MAKWKPFDLTWGRSIYACSACAEAIEVPTCNGEPLYNFCPMCGANMTMKSENNTADTPQTDCEGCEHWKYIAHEWQCETEKCQKTPQTDCPVDIVFGCDECYRPKCDYKNCRRCKWFATDKCRECFGNELYEDSGYVTQTNCVAKMKGAEDYERATEQMEHDALYEPTYNSEDGSM